MRFVLPGDRIDLKLSEDKTVILGPGIREVKGQVIAVKEGILNEDEKNNKISVLSRERWYCPGKGDSVIGVIVDRKGDYYTVDIGSYGGVYANLPSLAFEGATKRNKPNLKERSLVYCHISKAPPKVEPEVICYNPASQKSDGYGELEGGFYVITDTLFTRMLLSAEECDYLAKIGSTMPFETAIGANGRLWVKAGNLKDTMTIAKSLEEASRNNSFNLNILDLLEKWREIYDK